jgi:ABC-type multidrug transport system permease subunit
MNTFVLPAWTLWLREITRFYRDRSRVIGSLAPPLLFWLLIGYGLAGSFRAPGSAPVAYLEYLFAGVAVLIVLFTAIFSTISIIEDRREGFMQFLSRRFHGERSSWVKFWAAAPSRCCRASYLSCWRPWRAFRWVRAKRRPSWEFFS